MTYSQWAKTVSRDSNKYITKNLSQKGSVSEVDTTVNSYNHSYGTNNTLRINSSSEKDSGVRFVFPYLEVGDYVEIEAEYRILNGDVITLKVSEYNETTDNEGLTGRREYNGTSEWSVARFKHYITLHDFTIKTHSAFIGLAQGQSGIIELRSVRAIAYCKTNEVIDKIDRGFYRYIIKKVSGNWVMQNGSSEGKVTMPYNWTLKLEYPAISYPSLTIASNVGNEYQFGFNTPTSNVVDLKVKKTGDEAGDSVNWTALPENTLLYINVFYEY